MHDGETSRDPRHPPAILPWEALVAWPRERPVAVLNRGEGEDPEPRWTLLTEPASPSVLAPATGPRSPHDAEATAAWLAERLPSGPLASAIAPEPGTPPWATGVVALLAYELGARLEPAASPPRRAPAPDRPSDAGPARWDAWVADATWSVVFDHRRERWHRMGDVPPWIERILAGGHADPRDDPAAFRLGPLHSTTPDERFEAMVARCVELVHAGDLFQANLSRGFEASFEGDPRRLAAATLAAGARFGAFVETSPDEAVLSLSPELLVATEAGGRVRTCPIKGTRPAGADLSAFAADAKDAAELAMIVDLMRNDLGRICRPGSVRVVEARRLERHPTIVHGVAEVEGRLRAEIAPRDLLEAVFPAGSISGAPKIRAMQVIESLEATRRGIYCGSVGWFDRSRGAVLNVGIRTATLRRPSNHGPWSLSYRAGCGIVADSDPASESRESRDKTAVLARHATPVTPPGEARDPVAAAVPRSPR